MDVTWETLTVALMVGLAATVVSAQVANPLVTTDKSIDTSTLKSLVADVTRGCSSQQDKAIALFEYARRMIHHYPNRVDKTAEHDPLHLINTYGYSFCSQQAQVTTGLWKAAGIEGYSWTVPGHTTMQAEYDGGYHWFDLLIGAYVFGRDGKTIVSLEDIAKDKTLLTKAVEEGRAPKGFVSCGAVLRDDPIRFSKHDPKYIKECTDLIDDVNYMATHAAVAKKWQWGPPPKSSSYDPGMTLRPGESVEYLWDYIPDQANCNVLAPGEAPKAYWVTVDDLPPHHFCGEEAEKRDVINYKYWKPYTKTVQGVRTGRYATNGRHVWQPDLGKRPAEGCFETNSFKWWKPAALNLPALRVAKANEPSELVLAMKTPHIYTSARLAVELFRAADGDVNEIFLCRMRRDGQTKQLVEDWEKVWDAGQAKAGKLNAEIELPRVRNTRLIKIKLLCKTAGDPGKAGLNALGADAIFQHNMFARPYLVPGDNKITVRMDRSQPGGMEVAWAWEEGQTPRTDARKITFSPTVYDIKVGGEEMPRMISLKLSVAK